MLEPKYDEDTVNLGYLKKVISDAEEGIDNTYKNVSRHYASKPQPPYYKGDTWIDGNIVYTCINTRTIGLYQDSDWVTESGAKVEAERKNKTYISQPSNYNPGDMWILQSDEDHRAGQKGEILISTAGRKEYNADDWINMLGYGTMKSINEVAGNLNNAINRIGDVEEAIQDGLIITFYQDTVPEGKHLGDLWYVTGEVEGYTTGKIYRYDGTSWIILNDPAIQKAFDEANEARLVADGKIQSFYSEAEPTQNMGVGDLWIDLSNNNQLYRYNGTNWVAVYDTRINELVTTVETVTERVTTVETDLGEIDLKVKETTTKITTIEGNIDNIETLANNAQSTADSAVEGVNNITNTQGEAEGKSIHIEDSAEEPFVDISLHGETSQKTRSGKNTLGLTNGTYTNRGITAVVSNGVITLSGTSSDSSTSSLIDIPLIKPISTSAGTLIKSLNPTGTYTEVQTSLRASNPNNSVGLWSNNGANQSGTLSGDAYYFRIQIVYNKTVNCTLKPQVESGSTATDYEQYGVMPSPDYPSEIENIEGKNKFNVNGNLEQITGIHTTVSNNQIHIPNSEGNSHSALFDYIEVEPNKDINISFDLIQGAARIGLRLYDKDKNIINSSSISLPNFTYIIYYKGYFYQGNNISTTIPDNVKYIRYLTIGMNGTEENIYENLQIEKGNKRTPYVPYNSLEFKVEGKNIFNKNDIHELNANLNNGNITDAYAERILWMKCKPNTTYSFKKLINSPYGRNTIAESDTVPAIGGTCTILRTYTPSEIFTVTTSSTAKYLLWWYYNTSSTNYTKQEILDSMQIEENTESTTYEPYKSQVATFPLGEGKLMEGSYLADDGIHHRRKQVVLDGTESWFLWAASLNNVERFFVNLATPTSNEKTALCSHFKYLSANQDEEHFRWSISQGEYKQFVIFIDKSKATTVAELKTWLKSNPITVEYELAEPETVPYTEEQQEAWNKIKALMTYKNITNITSTAYAKVTYMRDNGLDVYETKQNAQKKYTETSEKLAEQKMTVDGVITQVSETNKRLTNDYLTAEQVNAELGTTKEDIEIIKQNQVTMTQTSKNLQIAIDTINNEGVSKVKTSMGYTFDDEGFKLNRSNAETGTIIDEAAVKVIDKTGASEQNLLYAGYVKEGNTNYPSYIGQTIVASANMIVQNYLVVPNSRFEEYTNPVLGGKGTGVFEV